MEDRSRYWGDVEARSSLRGDSASFWNRGINIAEIGLETPWYEMDRAGIERVKEIAAKIGGNGIITSSSRKIRVVDVPQLSRWSQSPFYDPNPNIRFKRVIDKWNQIAKMIFEMGPEMDHPEELILAEAVWWDWTGRITTLKDIYRAESDGSGDFDEALRLYFDDASQEVFQDHQQVGRMCKYHEDDEFTEVYKLIHEGLETLTNQFACERDLWCSRTGR